MKKFLTHLLAFTLLTLLIFPNFPACCEDDNKESSSKKVVYLTFDDAPGGKVTEKTLDILKRRKCPCYILYNWRTN